MTAEAFEALLTPHLQMLRNFVRSRLRKAEIADDVLQQVLLRAFARRDQLRSASKFKSWLLSIAFNEVRLFFRLHRSNRLEAMGGRDFVDRTPSPFIQCERRETAQRVQAGLAQLCEGQRTAIHLVDFHGLTEREAAEAMTVSVSAFKSTLFRGRQRLGKELRRAA